MEINKIDSTAAANEWHLFLRPFYFKAISISQGFQLL